MERFRAENMERVASNRPGQPIVMLGDSLTYGFPADYFFPESDILNRGVMGDTIDGVKARLQSSVWDVAPSKVLLMIGINNLLVQEESPEMVAAQYADLLTTMKANPLTGRVYVFSILPVAGQFIWMNPSIRESNRLIRELAEAHGYAYFDLYSYMVDSGGNLNAGYTTDGVHLNGVGYTVWATAIRPIIDGQQSPPITLLQNPG